jgi:hypothetical protein
VNDSDFNPQEQGLINRLANAPQPSLNPAAFELIRARMLDAMDQPIPDAPDPGQIRPQGGLTITQVAILGLVIAAAIVVILVIVVIISAPKPIQTPVSTVPSTTIPTLAVTVTPLPQVIATLADTAMPTQTALPEPTQTLTPEVTPDSIPEATPEITSTPTLEPVIVVEGPVQNIEGNVVTIFGIEIILNPDDPLLNVIEVGDVLHVEADYATDTTLIIAVTVEPVSNEVNTNPDTGESWRDNGNCDNPPPPWAPANGWRRRCGVPGGSAPNPGNGNGNGMGMGNDG